MGALTFDEGKFEERRIGPPDSSSGYVHWVTLHAWQRDDGSWCAMVYRPNPAMMIDPGFSVFSGIAATEERARQLARDAADTRQRKAMERE